ncbi:MAG: carboxypeptidase-like regulatory domain-containing protein [Acutalibacteraceae bacterium]|nr:carboxypeptidase-like regulatory domain-containing protein [Acutalibacteraceae bacterium]
MNKKIVKPIALILVAALLMSFSLAYFTDRAETQANGTAGTVAISLANNINLLDADGQDIINPGDQRAAGFAVTNEGNKSIDVRTTVALTAMDYAGQPINFSGDTDVQSEYDLYLASDVELVEGKGYAPKTGATPLQVKSINGNVITYRLPVYSLNGNSDKYTEVETIDGIDAFTKNHDLVMIMKGEAGNAWQASSIRMDVLVEAKQHENTAAGWTIVATENVTHGSINQDAVLAEDVITALDGSANGTITFSLRDATRDAGISNVTMKLVKLPDSTLSPVDTLGGTVLATVRSDANGTGRFTRLEEGKYALVSPNFVLTTEAENLEIVGVDGTDHYEYNGTMDWAATVEGTIKDEAGDPVSDVEVNIVDDNQDFVAGSTTNTNGEFAIYPVVAGEYDVQVKDNQILAGTSYVTVTEGTTEAIGEVTVKETAPIFLAAYLNSVDDSNPTVVNITDTLANDDVVTLSEVKNLLNNYYTVSGASTSSLSLATTYSGDTQIGGGNTQIGGGSFSYPVYLNIYTNGIQAMPLKTVAITSNSALLDNQLTLEEAKAIVESKLDGDLSGASYQLYDDMWMPTSSISVDNTMGNVNIIVMVNGYVSTPQIGYDGLYYFTDINNPSTMFDNDKQDTIINVQDLANGQPLYIGIVLTNCTKN